MRLLKAAAAAILLVALVVVPPWALVRFIGSPWPAEGVSLSAPLTDGAILGLLAVIVWILWAQLMVCIAVEMVSALSADRLQLRAPLTMGVQQQLARSLIAAVVLATVAGPVAMSGTAVAADSAAPTKPTASPTTSQAAPSTQAEEDRSSATPERKAAQAPHAAGRRNATGPGSTVTVMRLDSLWSIAERVLGDGDRWPEIAALNEGRVMHDGTTFMAADHIRPGWTLLVPGATGLDHGGDMPADHAAYQVKPGDSLSSIAEEELGDALAYPKLFEASTNIEQPGGTHLTDPDLIQPGWTIAIPAPEHAPPGAVTAPQELDDQAGEAREPQPQRREATPTASPTTPAEAESGNSNRGAAPTATSVGEHDDEGELTALRALLASAVCLSAGALGLLMTNRRRQFRRRRVGRTVASIPDELLEVEQAVHENGSAAQEDVEFLDRALRHVAASCKVAEAAMPQLGAAVLSEEDLTLLFTHPAQAPVPEGWTSTDDARAWMLPRWTFLEPDLETQPAPYPAVVSIGEDDGGRTWLLDLETLGRCGIAGEPEQVTDLVRFVVAELAVNAWSEGSDVLLADEFGTETLGLNPARLRQVARSAAIARAEAVLGEMDAVEANLGADLLTRRRDGLVLDSAHPVVVVVSSRPAETFLTGVSQRDRSRVVVVHGGNDDPAVELAGDGTAFLPMWGISLRAFTLPAAEAQAMADLVASTRDLHDQPVPATTSDDGPLGKYANADGSLREEYIEPRRTEGNDPSSQLPEADAVYLATAATTAVDLAVAAPSVPEETRAEIASLDPNLDQDVADWFDETSPRPKIHLLGPVTVTSLNGGDPGAIDNLGGTISFIAYLACQDRGVTGERAAAACGWETQKTVQNRATNARFVLGTRPDGSDWLPDASMSDGARRGSTPTYDLVRGPGGVLNSADLFVRLKFRAQKRGDQGGEDDLVRALSLVTGAPFEAATEHRFKWLFKVGQQRHDEILVGAIHDAAHVLATRAVAEGRTDLVRLACAAAQLASPHSDIAWLDAAAATEAESGRDAAGALVREQVLERLDEDLPARSEMIVDQREWGATG